MANTLIQKVLNPSSFIIYDEQYELSVWSDIRVSRVEIEVHADTAKNPISTEYVQADPQAVAALAQDLLATKVVQPSRVVVDCFVESISTVLAIVVAFEVQTKTFKLTSKGIVAEGMAITEVDLDQSTEMLSAIKVKLTFEQAELIDRSGWNPLNSGDSDTYGISVQPSTSVAGTLQSVYNKVSSLWS